MTSLLLSLALGAGALGGFPCPLGGAITQPAVGLVLDGAPAVVAVAGSSVAAVRADCVAVRGFPVRLGAGESASGAPAAGDVDGDGRPEIAVATLSGKLVLLSGSAAVPGFPVSLGAKARAGPSFVDVDGDGKPEVVVGDAAGKLHAFKKNGREAAGFPLSLGAAVTSTASASRFGGGPSLAVGCADGKVHVIDLATRGERRGFPLRTAYEVTGAPAFADVDGDGAMDLVVASQDYKLYAVNGEGAALPGFPFEAGYRLYEGPAVADLDGEGTAQIAFTSADGFLHLVGADAKERPGFPVRVGARVFGGAVIGDLDRDGKLDVAAVSSDGVVVAVTGEGAALPGFPTRFDVTDLGATPALVDLLGDQSLSVFVGFPTGELHAVRALRFGAVAAAAPWAGPGHDAAHTGRHGPNPPRYRGLAVEPAAPRTGDGLRAAWRWVSLDAQPGEAEPPPQIDWYRNGALVPDLRGARAVPPRRARKGEAWRFALVARGGLVYRSPEVRVADTPPTPPEVALDPARPVRGVPVRAALAKPAVDADGDAVTYRYEWLQDGLATGVTGSEFPGDRLKKGVLLTARVYASDGEAEADPVVVEARVADAPPSRVAIALEPPVVHRGDALAVKLVEPATDADGDAVSYRYRWKVDGEPRNLPLGAARLAPNVLRKHQRVAVEVRAWDGEVEGPPATGELLVANGPPGAPKVELRPAAPRRGEAVRAVLVAEAADPDGDVLRYHYEWKKNGAPLALPRGAREVPGAEVARGDRFEVAVWADDGEAEGPRATAAATVVNTPPTPPAIALEPARPHGGEPLRAVVLRPSVDADGDPVTYAFAWSIDGRPLPGADAEVLPAALVAKHRRVRVAVTPRDGLGAGAPGVAEALVANAVPGKPEVALVPERPVAGKALEARLAAPAPDADGDAIRYRYRWLRDGFAVAVSDGSAASAREPFWTAAAEVPARELAKGQRWAVEVQAFDGEAYGPVARARAAVANTPPPPPRVSIAPAAPRRDDGLRVTLEQPPDADGDAVTYRYTWWRDGRRTEHAGPEVPRGAARRGERWKVEVVASDGEAEAPPATAEVVVANTPPGAPALSLCDGPVATGTALEVKLASPSRDADGDEVSYRYAWTVNGKPAVTAQPRLGAEALRKHDVARVVVTPFDGHDAGPAAAAECAVDDTPPTRAEIALEPAAPTAESGLRVRIVRPATDRDGDAVTYRYAWTRDGAPVDLDGAEVPRGALRHGETWRVAVRAFDGEAEGEPASAAASVANTPPPAPALSIRPESPATGDALSCRASAPEKDADGEPVEVRYRWSRNGEAMPFGEGSAELPPGVVRRGERWRCEAWTSDGAAESAHAAAEVRVKNGAPGAPQVLVEPEAPRKGDALACRIAADATDPDGDRLTYSYAWWKDDAPLPAGRDPTRVTATAKRQRFRCAVTASDGELRGPPAVAERTVLDTPPGPARVRVAPAAPRTGAPLRCEIVQKAEDADGDAVRYLFAWVKNGEPQPFSAATDEVPVRLVRAGDRWRCVVTPTDGELEGPPSGSPEVVVLPGAGDDRISREGGGRP